MRRRGFTLIELLVAMGIIVLLSAIALASTRNIRSGLRLSGGVNTVTAALELGRSLAIQNGEPVRPEQGYPMRLFNPGWEGNTSVKWLTQIKVTRNPLQFRDETSKYTDTLPDRTSLQFTFPMDVKSLITSPSGQMRVTQGGI